MDAMDRFKVLVNLAISHDSGAESHWKFSADSASSFVNEALDCLDLTLPDSMSTGRKIEWLRAIA